jgi:AcrR family transcriptional regulator
MSGTSRGAERAPYRLGLRADAQVERRRRVLEAAEALFHEKGLEATGMREIAQRAGVGTGTLFLYAPDKRGLLRLIHDEQLRLCQERAFATVDPAAGLVDQIVHVFGAQYVYLSADTRLSLQAVQEASFVPAPTRDGTSFEDSDYFRRRIALRQRLADLVIAQQERGTVVPGVDPIDVAEIAISIYVTEVREWLIGIEIGNEKTDVEKGVEQLRRRLAFALSSAFV